MLPVGAHLRVLTARSEDPGEKTGPEGNRDGRGQQPDDAHCDVGFAAKRALHDVKIPDGHRLGRNGRGRGRVSRRYRKARLEVGPGSKFGVRPEAVRAVEWPAQGLRVTPRGKEACAVDVCNVPKDVTRDHGTILDVGTFAAWRMSGVQGGLTRELVPVDQMSEMAPSNASMSARPRLSKTRRWPPSVLMKRSPSASTLIMSRFSPVGRR